MIRKRVNFRQISVHGAPEHSPGFLLWYVSTVWRRTIEETLKPIGLTHPQFVILATIGWLTRNDDRVTQAAIGIMAGLDPNTVSQVIRGLEQKELVKRVASSDGRAKHPLLTKQGTEVLKQALPAVEAEDARFFHPLTDKEMKCMIRLFRKLTF